MSIKTMLGRAASQVDRAFGGSGLRTVLSHHLKNYGQVLDCRVDSRDKTAFISLLLAGESEPVSVQVGEYGLLAGEDGSVEVCLHGLACDRQWMQALLQDFVEGKSFPVPDQHRDLVRGYLG